MEATGRENNQLSLMSLKSRDLVVEVSTTAAFGGKLAIGGPSAQKFKRVITMLTIRRVKMLTIKGW